MIWKTYLFIMFCNLLSGHAFVTTYKKHNYIRTQHQSHNLNNEIEVYESLILNGIITSGSLRLMDRVIMPQRECSIVKITILIISEFVICITVC